MIGGSPTILDAVSPGNPANAKRDLADAPLYWLAVETCIVEMITVDRNDFERYRLTDGQAFILR
ncbi:MAG: hypothetical protein ACRERU_12145 [Methylococcales bacterium]